jgi:hypothetical protein
MVGVHTGDASQTGTVLAWDNVSTLIAMHTPMCSVIHQSTSSKEICAKRPKIIADRAVAEG